MIKEEEQRESIKKSVKVTSAYMLQLFRHPVGTTAEFNPSFLLMAENLDEAPATLRTGGGYLRHTRQLMQEVGVDISNVADLPSKPVDGRTFDGMGLDMHTPGGSVHQEYYSTVAEGYALSVILSFATPDQQDSLHQIFDQLHFKPAE